MSSVRGVTAVTTKVIQDSKDGCWQLVVFNPTKESLDIVQRAMPAKSSTVRAIRKWSGQLVVCGLTQQAALDLEDSLVGACQVKIGADGDTVKVMSVFTGQEV